MGVERATVRIWILVPAVMLVAILATPFLVHAQSSAGTEVYVNNSLDAGLSSDIVVAPAPGHTVDRFAVRLTFDPVFIAFASVSFVPPWQATVSFEAPGTLLLAGSSDSDCAVGTTCPLATIHWNPLSNGASAIRIADATLSEHGGTLTGVTTVGANLIVTMPAGSPSPAPQESRQAGDIHATTEPAPASANSEGFITLATIAAFAVIVALGSVIVVILARRLWNWSARPVRDPGNGSARDLRYPESGTQPVVAAAAEYFNHVEAAGATAELFEGPTHQSSQEQVEGSHHPDRFHPRSVAASEFEKARLKPQRW
jgi:hypothetical protein